LASVFLLFIKKSIGWNLRFRPSWCFAWEAVGAVKAAGQSATGSVFEQTIRVVHEDKVWLLRRVTVVLTHATKDGEQELHVLTNLKATDADACRVAELYRRRWAIEGVFQELTVAKAALRAAHGAEHVAETVSDYRLVEEVQAVYEGLEIAAAPEVWAEFQTMTAEGFGRVLMEWARHVKLERFRKQKRGPNKLRPKRTSGTGNTHVSTARLLATRKKTRPC
jgi:hypothetical protein